MGFVMGRGLGRERGLALGESKVVLSVGAVSGRVLGFVSRLRGRAE